jgi:hypothetical protein
MDAIGLTVLLKDLAVLAEQLAVQLPIWSADFGERVKGEQAWT